MLDLVQGKTGIYAPRDTLSTSTKMVMNPATGAGTANDSSVSRAYSKKKRPLSCKARRKNVDLAMQDGIMQNIIIAPVLDMLQTWRNNDELTFRIEKAMGYQSAIMHAVIGARKYGKSLLYPVVGDTEDRILDPRITLNAEKQASEYTVKKIVYFDEFKESKTIIDDPLNPLYGEPEFYTINGVEHDASRVVPVYGNFDKNVSAFEAVQDYFEDWGIAKIERSRSIQEANFLILKTALADLEKRHSAQQELKGGSYTFQDAMQARVRNLKQNANSANAFILDKEEEAQQVDKKNIKAVSETVNDTAKDLAGGARIPASYLFSQEQSGLNNSSQSSMAYYINTLKTLRFFVIENPMRVLDSIVSSFDEDFTPSDPISWNALALEEILQSNQTGSGVQDA